MSYRTAMKRLLVAGLVCWGSAGLAQAQPPVAKMLEINPKCNDSGVPEPAKADLGAFKVQNVPGPNGGVVGFVLLDGQNKPLRKFTGSGQSVDTWTFFKDGAEVYREQLVQNKLNVRWIGNGGMKWGVAEQTAPGKFQITAWRMISAEEAANEAFQALATGEYSRLEAVLITPQEIASLGLPAQEAQRLNQSLKNAPQQFQKVRAKVTNLPKAMFSRLESAQPGAYPADITGATNDLIKITRGLILFENPSAEKKHDYINAQEMIQIGQVWRLTDVPGLEDTPPTPDNKLLDQIAEIDRQLPGATGKKLIELNLMRVQLTQKVAETCPANERESWYKQVIDGLAAATAAGDEATAPQVLAKWKQSFANAQPGGNMAAYAHYREIWSLFQAKMAKNPSAKEYPKLQTEYNADIEKFIQAYPKAEDTPDALQQIAMNTEFNGKDTESKKWYQQIVTSFPTHMNTPKAAGAIRRLDSVGQNFELAGKVLGGGQTFEMTAVKGKIVVAYYWASNSGQAVGDFATLKKLQQDFPKELAIVTISLDDTAAAANAFLQRSPLPGYHLHQEAPNGGMNSPLATQYGIFGLPHLFLVGADGKVVNNKIQMGMLQEEIEKLVKK
jgi:hypothetical protein